MESRAESGSRPNASTKLIQATRADSTPERSTCAEVKLEDERVDDNERGRR